MAQSKYHDGCPITTTLLEIASIAPGVAKAGKDVFSNWQAIFIKKFRDAGIAEKRAESLASVAIAALQGSPIFSREERDATPIKNAAEELATLFDSVA